MKRKSMKSRSSAIKWEKYSDFLEEAYREVSVPFVLFLAKHPRFKGTCFFQEKIPPRIVIEFSKKDKSAFSNKEITLIHKVVLSFAPADKNLSYEQIGYNCLSPQFVITVRDPSPFMDVQIQMNLEPPGLLAKTPSAAPCSDSPYAHRGPQRRNRLKYVGVPRSKRLREQKRAREEFEKWRRDPEALYPGKENGKIPLPVPDDVRIPQPKPVSPPDTRPKEPEVPVPQQPRKKRNFVSEFFSKLWSKLLPLRKMLKRLFRSNK